METQKKISTSPEWAALAGVATILAANYISSQALDYPFLYCSLWPYFEGMYMAYGPFVLMICVILLGYNALKGRIRESLFPLGFMVAYTNLPRVVSLLLNTGGSCV
jgi:hypothetical protein